MRRHSAYPTIRRGRSDLRISFRMAMISYIHRAFETLRDLLVEQSLDFVLVLLFDQSIVINNIWQLAESATTYNIFVYFQLLMFASSRVMLIQL